MNVKKIEKSGESALTFTWADGKSSTFEYKFLRDRCPCASCSGESVLLHTYTPNRVKIEMPGMYEIKGIQPVGNYAVNIQWGDGHNTGIYSWEFLSDL
jgi:DUF971 family protein